MDKLRKEVMEAIEKYSKEYEKVSERKGVQVSGKKIGADEFKAATSAILDGWWTDGPYTKEFEDNLCDYIGVKHASFVNSGSSANLLALASLTSRKLGEKRLKKGDEVITTACNFPTTVNPIIQHSLFPVFCDVNLGTYNINIEELKNAVSNKTKCIFLAHTLGNPFDVNAVKDICEDNNLFLIEDSCDALGSTYNGKKVGSFGDIATLSFYPAHHITAIEGGAVLTDDDKLNKIIRSMRDWGRDCICPTGKDNVCGKRFDIKKGEMGNLPEGYDHKYIYSEMGYNLKSTDINAAIGIEQLKKVEKFRKIRENNFMRFYAGLKQFKDIFILPEAQENSVPSWFGFPLTLKDGCNFTRRELLKYLDTKNISSRLIFAGNITKQPYFIDNEIDYRKVGDLNNSDIVMNSSFWLGNNQLLDDGKIDYMISNISKFLSK